MKPLALILFASALATAAQTPYDSFAPEQAEKAMIELDRSEYSLVNPDSSGTVRCIVISWVDGTYNAFDQAGIAAEGSIDPLDKKFHTMDPKMEEMPQVSPYVYCFANPIGYTDLSGLKPSMEEAAAMADYVYGKKDVILIGKWIPSENTKYNLVSKTGLKTMLFQQDIGEGKVEYALAFAGTEWDTPVDAINDCLQLYGLSAQYQEGMTIGKEALNLEGELTFVGHSLGGRIERSLCLCFRWPSYDIQSCGSFYLDQIAQLKCPNRCLRNHNRSPYHIATDELLPSYSRWQLTFCKTTQPY